MKNIMAHTCPTCYAGPNSPCRTVTDMPMTGYHQTRKRKSNKKPKRRFIVDLPTTFEGSEQWFNER